MKFGYARVSKNEQSLDVQIQKLTAAGCDEIFEEKISGAKDDRPQLKTLIGKLRKGDTLCVVRLDRLGRRMMKLVELINEFKEKGIEFVSLENNLVPHPINKAIINLTLFVPAIVAHRLNIADIRPLRVLTGTNSA